MRCLRLTMIFAIALACGFAVPAGAQAPAPPVTAEPPPGGSVMGTRQPGDAFGQEVTLPARSIVYVKGQSGWDKAYETLQAAFKALHAALDKAGIKPSGPSMVIYTETDEKGFSFEAALPVAKASETPLGSGISAGQAPSGKALKFVHRGSYDAMDSTYDTITEYLDEKNLDATDPFLEEYVTDPLTTPADRLQVNIYVPVK
ncbi:MAG TPA: GyrI-like domain-containing protein [Pseudolabrys sp.]|jgi:effector-binding domain-containing protein|nr:GyrI-like domain-containing protein [Pseudolabrys sp.]